MNKDNVRIRGGISPREVLNEIKWRGLEMKKCTVEYVHRGAPGNRMTIKGNMITSLGGYFMQLGDTSIPYHRIRRIDYDGRAVYIKN